MAQIANNFYVANYMQRYKNSYVLTFTLLALVFPFDLVIFDARFDYPALIFFSSGVVFFTLLRTPIFLCFVIFLVLHSVTMYLAYSTDIPVSTLTKAILNLSIGYVVFKVFSNNSENTLKFVTYLLVFITFVALCETFSSTARELLLEYRAYAFLDQRIYLQDERDFVLYGAIRPYTFFSEPSYQSVTVAALATYLILKSPKISSSLVILLTILVILTRSPSMGLVVIAICIQLVRNKTNLKLIIFLFGILFVLLVSQYNRIFSTFSTDSSTNARIFASLLAAKISITEFGLFGVGTGNTHLLNPHMYSQFIWSNNSSWIIQNKDLSHASSTAIFQFIQDLGILMFAYIFGVKKLYGFDNHYGYVALIFIIFGIFNLSWLSTLYWISTALALSGIHNSQIQIKKAK